MARVAFSLVGAGLGSLVGMPALGAVIGGITGTLLFPNRPQNQNSSTEGPRLEDMSVMSSSAGVPITRGFGTFRTAGNLIWSPGLREHKHVDTVTSGGKGGGGSSTQTSTTYTYTASFAVALGQGEVDRVLTIWADSKIIFDSTGVAAQTSNAGVIGGDVTTVVSSSLTTNPGGSTRKTGLTFRVYAGTNTQRPDPLIEADPRIQTNHAPAFRGLAYIVFENVPLGDFGNRIPQIQALVTYRGTSVSPYATVLKGGDFGVASLLAMDPLRNRFYGFSYNTLGKLNLVSYDGTNFSQLRAVEFATPVFIATTSNVQGKGLSMGPDGMLYCVGEVSGTSCNLWRVDPISLIPIAKSYYPLPTVLDGPLMWQLGYDEDINLSTVIGHIGFAACYGLNGLTGMVITRAYVSHQLGAFTLGDLNLEWYDGKATSRQCTDAIKGIHTAHIGQMSGFTYITGHAQDNSAFNFWKFTLSAEVEIDLLGGVEQTTGIYLQKKASYTASDIATAAGLDPTGRTIKATGFGSTSQFDLSDGSVLACVMLTGGSGDVRIIFKWRESIDAIIWATVVPAFWPAYSEGLLIGGSAIWMSTTNIYELATGSGVLTTRTFGHSIGGSSAQYYLPDQGAIVTRPHTTLTANPGYSASLVAALISVGGGIGAYISDIIVAFAEEAGLSVLDVDTSLIDDVKVDGYFVARVTTAAEAIRPLLEAHAIDQVDTGEKLLYVPRGQASVRTITQASISAPTSSQNDNEWLTQQEQADWDLPAAVTLTWIDPAKAFQQNTLTVRRPSNPTRTMSSVTDLTVTIPVAWSINYARARAETILYTAWSETRTVGFSTSWDQLDLIPTDVVTLQLDNGLDLEVRLTDMTIGADFSIEFKGTLQESPTYTGTEVDGLTPMLSAAQRVVADTLSQVIIFQVPFLRDDDNPGATHSCIYYTATGFNDAWRGAEVSISTDNVTYTPLGQIISQTAWGVTTNALPDDTSPFVWDDDTELNVWFTINTNLESVSDSQVLTNFANAFAVETTTPGVWEIIQAANIVEESDGSFTLSRLLRGRRGTDVYCGMHTATDRIFALTRFGAIDRAFRPVAEIGTTLYAKAATFGSALESAPTVAFSLLGIDLHPYMPTNVIATNNAGNIDLTWHRRTRFQGDLAGGTGFVPLNEEAEEYEIDILDGPGGAVTRTLVSTEEAVTYASADVVADFGSVPATLSFLIYQMSGVVGRGLSREMTIEVT